MNQVTRSEFEAELRHWFQAENLPEAEIDRLFRLWQERESDWMYISNLETQFDPHNQAAFGRAWWEERQKGESHYAALPITQIDLVKMWLSKDPLAKSPRARPWCPGILVGGWRLAGVREEMRDEWTPVATPREMTLHEDGRMDMDGTSRYQGWTWKAHRSGDSYYLYVGPHGEPLPARWPVYGLENGEMSLATTERPRYLLWRRIT